MRAGTGSGSTDANVAGATTAGGPTAGGPVGERTERRARPRPPRADREAAPIDVAALADATAAAALGDGPLLDVLLAALGVAVAVLDHDLRFVRVNDAFARIAGRSAEDHRGRTLTELLGEDGVVAGHEVRRVLATGRPHLDRRVVGETADAPGRRRYARVSYLPVPAATGTTAGVLALVVDTTGRVRASATREQALRAARRAQAAAERAGELQALLAEIGRDLASTLDVEAAVRQVVDRLVPRVAGRVSVRLRDAGGAEREVAAAAARPAVAPPRPPDVADAAPGEPHAEDLHDGAAGDPQALADLAPGREPPVVELLLPIAASGAPLGTLAAEGRFGTVERGLLESVASRIAIAAETARLHAAERRARSAAEAANAAKSSFLATMSHEIRTPINAIMGYTELLEMGLSGPLSDRQRLQLARVRASSVHLLGLVNDVLDLAKVEAGRLRVERERASAAASVRGALTLVQPQADMRGIHLVDVCDAAADARYLGDPQRVEQILVNLLSNAVRFTEPGGRVTVTCELADEPPADAQLPAGTGCVCALRVEDTGIGIEPAALDAVFEPFVQVESGHTRTREGSGLGLAISRRLARLMGGDLTAESAPGRGSTFTLTLPGVPSVAPDGGDGECRVAERRDTARHARGLVQVGEALGAAVDDIVARTAARVRTDPQVPSARALSEVALRDHTATLVMDYAQALSIIEAAGGAPTQLMRDGAEIQRVIADRHGRLRHGLGYTEAELVREFVVLASVVAEAVHALAPEGAGTPEALSLLATFMERACDTSVESYRRAGGALPPRA